MYSVGLTNAPLASAVQLGALQVTVVTIMMRGVLVVVWVLVVHVVLGLLNNIVSRTSTKQKAAMLIMSQREKKSKTQTHTKLIQPINQQ